MAFVAQNPSGKFVAFGKKKAREGSYVVNENENITGKVLKIKRSPTYGFILEMKTKEEPDPLIVLGTTILNRELGFDKVDGKWVESKKVKQVQEGDVIRITFLGMIKTEKGQDAYNLKVEVDR